MSNPPGIEQLTRATFAELAPERERLAAMDEDILGTQIAVSRIPAPTGAEDQRAAWIANRLREYGLDVRRDDAGNVIARLEAGTHAPPRLHAEPKDPVVLAAHLDTVFARETPLEFTRRGSRVVGPGICDNGRGLAALLATARTLAGSVVRRRFVRPVELVATVGEEGEGDLRGARHYLAGDSDPFAFIALDGAGDRAIVTHALGSRRFRVEFGGPGGHSWSAYGVPNPVHAGARCAALLSDLRMPRGERATLSVTRIGGGVAVNAIAPDAWLEVDIRSASEHALVQLERAVRDAAASAAATERARAAPDSGTLAHAVTCIGARPAGIAAAASPVVGAAFEATRLAGVAPQAAAASTDANVAMARGIPAIAIGGGGDGGDAHTPHEWFDGTRASAGLARATVLVATLALAAD